MVRKFTLGCFLFSAIAVLAYGYVEAPHSLGLVVRDSTNIVLMEVARVDKEKGLILYKRVKDLKGKHPTDDIKHNIGKRGFHAREWQNVMNWAEVGKKAIFFHNNGASETCIGTYWYQCYPEGNQWWGMSHAEPFLLRTFYGDIDRLAVHVADMLQGKQVVVTCLADGSKDALHQRKGKLQRLKASLKLVDYNAKRDFVGFGGDGDEIEEFKTITVLKQSTPGWKFQALGKKKTTNDGWESIGFNDSTWRDVPSPIGYGEPEILNRKGTVITDKGQHAQFRRWFEVPSDLLQQKGVVFRLNVASDDSADVYINGKLADRDPQPDHEFTYWNREVELPLNVLKPGKNLVAAHVRNQASSSDLYFDAEIEATVPLPKPTKKIIAIAKAEGNTKSGIASVGPMVIKAPASDPKNPSVLVVDRTKKLVALPCRIAPRKLANLNEIYPIEVIASYPAPHGRKAHETVVTFTDIKPSEVHAALESLGIKAGKPGRGEGAAAQGPEVQVQLEFDSADGKTQRFPIDQILIDTKSGKAPPKLRWHFTGSVATQPDPERPDKVYGADLTGTLLAVFPVTDETTFQTHLTLRDEGSMRLEVNRKILPKEGSPARLLFQLP